jgi:hypothetical protein
MSRKSSLSSCGDGSVETNEHNNVGGKIAGYSVGEIQCQGAVTAEINITGPGVPLQGFIDAQYKDSKTMDKRPGMYIKYLPYKYDEVTGKLLSGGSYLFDTWENAKDYARWSMEDYQVGDPKTPFWEQPMFESSVRNVWKVIGARNFAPVEEHAVSRLQKFMLPSTDVEITLGELYPKLAKVAEDQGAASIWLLYCPEEKMAAVQLAFKKVDGSDEFAAKHSLAAVAAKPSMRHEFPAELEVKPRFDRSSILLTLWLPHSRNNGGIARTIPFYPFVPAITTTDD